MSPAESGVGASGTPRITLDHIGVAMPDLGEALAKLGELFPVSPSEPEEVASEGVRLAFFDLGGPRLEVLEGTRDDSAITRYLQKRPPGVHHVSFRVEGVPIDEWFATLKGRGVRLLGAGPKQGSEGTRIFFVHPESTGGLLVEFSQKPIT